MPDNRAFVAEIDPAAGGRLWFLDGAGARQPVAPRALNGADGLSWGYEGQGPANTALSILAVATDAKTALDLHQAFMRDVLAKLAVNERFALPAAQVEAWLAANAVDGTSSVVRSKSSPATGAGGQDQDEDLARRRSEVERVRALDERERRLLERELRLDAMASALGLFCDVEQVTALPAEPVRRQLEALVVDSGDDVTAVARAARLDPRWAAAVASGTIVEVDVAHVAHLCEALACTPYDLWGTAGARSISHAYGPDAWPAATEALLPVDGVEAEPLAPSADWPPLRAGAASSMASWAPSVPELVRDFGPELAL